MADTEKKTETSASEDKKDKAAKPTGMEHWGEGGLFYIDSNGKRVRKPIKN